MTTHGSASTGDIDATVVVTHLRTADESGTARDGHGDAAPVVAAGQRPSRSPAIRL